MNCIRFLQIALLGLLFPLSCLAQTYYVRPGASGSNNGSDWNNAYSSLPSSLVRGATYYLATGSYGSYSVDDAASGSSWIRIRKATSGDHGTSTGWQSAYGTGQAVFSAAGTPISITSPYVELNGGTGSGNSGHGIRIEVTGSSDATRGVRITAANVVVEKCEITSLNPGGVADSSKQDGIYSTSGGGNITIRDCYIHNWKRCGVLLSAATNCVIEGCYFSRTFSTSGAHGQAVQLGPGACSDITIRYCVFKDCHGTGFIVYLDNSFSNIDTYGCVFWSTEPAEIGISYTSQAIGSTAGDTATGCDVYNNTFVNLTGRAASGAIDHNDSGSNNRCANNLWYNCNVMFDSATSSDSNSSTGTLSGTNTSRITGDPFVNSAAGDFRLKAATTAGVALQAPFNMDPANTERGRDGVWDRGAYEFGGTVSATPTDPSGLTLTPGS